MNMTEEQLLSWIKRAMQPVGKITINAVTEGHHIYCDGVQFALVDKGVIWFKSDDESDLVWDAAGSSTLSNTRKDGTMVYLHYRSAPDDAYDDEKGMRKWAKQGIAAGKRAKMK
ncbi:TfoX/Sxy family protein [Chitinophaga nivalis]|uniref:TfoX/Sxy family protein n=1 Tax=Chitinophaga nivalis TaxID=2991709 RepID=A0ABT3IFB3_9BACT|nr:TfoX/Sxy family protein [Chitinophaga nivalis]MCW3467664.1 TfoX/Sxy family protein [Chitinophaga nivalis]MCW3482644.1 TfoX/Sxy family protein [Chitinophaga nivalis]